jgi:hypothetical protein
MASPRKNRTAKKPERFWVTPCRVETIPHAKVRLGSHFLGLVTFKPIFAGTYWENEE